MRHLPGEDVVDAKSHIEPLVEQGPGEQRGNYNRFVDWRFDNHDKKACQYAKPGKCTLPNYSDIRTRRHQPCKTRTVSVNMHEKQIPSAFIFVLPREVFPEMGTASEQSMRHIVYIFGAGAYLFALLSQNNHNLQSRQGFTVANSTVPGRKMAGPRIVCI